MHHIIEIAPQRSVRRRALPCKLPVPHDRSEDIVEVMGDAAGQCPHRLHLLRLPQLRLQAFLVEFRLFLRAYVDCGADEPIRLAGRVAQTAATREQPMPRAVRLTYAVLALVLRRTPLEMIRYGGLEARHVGGAQAAAEGLLAPPWQGAGFFASDCELERPVPHACNGDEVPLAVDGIEDSLDLRNRCGNELREFLPDGTRRRRVAYQQRPVLAQ